MARFKSKLDQVRVAAPCHVDWDSMSGNDRQRFCGQCEMNVYNLSDMSRVEAEHFVGNAEGRVCIRYYRRRDGSIITNNCPVGLRALKRRMTRMGHAFASALLMFLGGLGFHGLVERVSNVVIDSIPLRRPYAIAGAMAPPETQGKMAIKTTEELVKTDSLITGRLVSVKKRPVKIKSRVRTAER